MLDTIGVEFPGIHIDQSLYSSWDDSGRKRKGSYFVTWFGFTVTLTNLARVQYTYYPFVSNGLLKVEFSLPHVIFGNNAQMVFDIAWAINLANQLLPIIPGIPPINLWEGRIYRLDPCYNHLVGDLVPWYIKALQSLEFPNRRTMPYTSQGVQYKNGQIILKLYDKERERRDKDDLQGALAARGVLRQELELYKYALKKLSGKKRLKLQDVTPLWILEILEKELQELDLLGRSIGTVNTTFKVLRENFGRWEALALVGLLELKKVYPSIDLLAQDAGLHPNSIGRHIQNKFVEKGLPPTLTEHFKPLPPLFIDRDYILSQSHKRSPHDPLPPQTV